MVKIKLKFLGKNISYKTSIYLMQQSMKFVQKNCIPGVGEILLLENQNTITFTKKYGLKNLLNNKYNLNIHCIKLKKSNRGGNITFHNTGQIIGYPIIKLTTKNDNKKYILYIKSYINQLETILLYICQSLGISHAKTITGYTGIWIQTNNKIAKVISIGIGITNYITHHGFAFNINNNINQILNFITPCGLVNMHITQLKNILSNTKQHLCYNKIYKTIQNTFNTYFQYMNK